MESATISIIVNGSPTNKFQPKRGLKQGDPMALFLFLIVVEELARLVRWATKKQLYRGVRVRKQGMLVNLLQFA